MERSKRKESRDFSHGPVAAYFLDYQGGHFVDMADGLEKNEVVERYSRMKFGSVRDMRFLAREMATTYVDEINNPNGGLLKFYQQMAQKGEHVLIFAPAFRNVESASNKLVESAVKLINIELARRGLPTIIISKLTRLFSTPANYATLSAAERVAINATAPTIDPDRNYFKAGVHAIFGDDIKVTGSTAKDLRDKCQSAGARSFSELYAVLVNPQTVANSPEIEETFNRFAIKGQLDQEIADILCQPDFQPVQRLLRLVLCDRNRSNLTSFLTDPTLVPDHALARLYLSALNNDYALDKKYTDSVDLLSQIARFRRVIDQKGWPVNQAIL